MAELQPEYLSLKIPVEGRLRLLITFNQEKNVLRRDFIGLAIMAQNVTSLLASWQSSSLSLESVMQRSNSQYADVNGLQLYYEIHGEGAPIVLLHGGVSASEVFSQVLLKLTKTRTVLAVHLQGHGHTKDIDRPLRFEFMADDVAALLGYLKIPKADLLGYSLGGGVALQTTIRHPAIVNRLVVISAAMKHDGSFPEVNAAFDRMDAHASQIAANIERSTLGQMYPAVNWESLLRKIAEMESQNFDWSEAIEQIKSPTMLLFADADSVRPEHIVEFYKTLGGGQRDAGLDGSLRSQARLGIVPNTTHYNILSSTIV